MGSEGQGGFVGAGEAGFDGLVHAVGFGIGGDEQFGLTPRLLAAFFQRVDDAIGVEVYQGLLGEAGDLAYPQDLFVKDTGVPNGLPQGERLAHKGVGHE